MKIACNQNCQDCQNYQVPTHLLVPELSLNQHLHYISSGMGDSQVGKVSVWQSWMGGGKKSWKPKLPLESWFCKTLSFSWILAGMAGAGGGVRKIVDVWLGVYVVFSCALACVSLPPHLWMCLTYHWAVYLYTCYKHVQPREVQSWWPSSFCMLVKLYF